MSTAQHLTSAGKEALRKSIRGLREALLSQLKEAAEREYRLGVPLEKARLPEDKAKKRQRLEAWLDEQSRADRSLVVSAKATKTSKRGKAGSSKAAKKAAGASDTAVGGDTANIETAKGAPRRTKSNDGQLAALRERYLLQAVKEASHTLINRLVIVRILEQAGLSNPAVVSGGVKSAGYREFTEYATALCSDAADATKAYAALLRLLFDELALELPGLFGNVGLTRLFPVPAATLHQVIDALNDPVLDSAWGDDTTLGWVYQFWNDPEREALDARVKNKGGKIEPHEVAAKTQMFTDRYMVEWLVQNSLGHTWLAICEKHRWTPDFAAVREALETRRSEWRKKQASGEVANDALMPLHSVAEEHWKYWVPQPSSHRAPTAAPESLRALKLMDPACGSGHFLVIAFEHLAALYQEEAQHRGQAWTKDEIARFIIEDNLHGIDIDPRAIQIAAAAVWLKAKTFAPTVRLRRMNLVAPVFKLGALPPDDPAVVALFKRLSAETRISGEKLKQSSTTLQTVAQLGSLLRMPSSARTRSASDTPDSAYDALEQLTVFLDAHSGTTDLGLRLDGEQLTAGIRFLRMARDGQYDIVFSNPPYLGIQKTTGLDAIRRDFGAASADLYSAFIQRATELATEHGQTAMVTMRSWMYTSQFERFRAWLLDTATPRLLCELGGDAFAASSNVEVVMWIAAKSSPSHDKELFAQRATDIGLTHKHAQLQCPPPAFSAKVSVFSKVRGSPVLYGWEPSFVEKFSKATLLGDTAPVRVGMKTSHNARFVRAHWELPPHATSIVPVSEARLPDDGAWVPYVKGASGKRWIEPLCHVVYWKGKGTAVRVALDEAYGHDPQCEELYFKPGVAYSTIGKSFIARLHRYRSIFDVAGSSVFPDDPQDVVCLLNARASAEIVEALNPTINFQVGDVARVPCLPDPARRQIADVLNAAFSVHESCRENSVEFKRPGPSSWASAQAWAQAAVDRAQDAPLPDYVEELEQPDPRAFVSFALGMGMGRFGHDGEGVLDLKPSLPEGQTLFPDGILFLSAASNTPDSLSQPAAAPLVSAWEERGPEILNGRYQSLNAWLREHFLAYHNGVYEGLPIYLPLSSRAKNFVAWVSIHRWADNTLQALLANYLLPTRVRLEGEQRDLNEARVGSDSERRGVAEKQFAEHQRLLDELDVFIDEVTQCAEKGPPVTGVDCPPREADARFAMDLEDGVVVNSAALWPLLKPQWRDPEQWWTQIAAQSGARGKGFDWAHLTARYFPERVRSRCAEEFNLSVAHGWAWRYHPAKAYAWELRLQFGCDASLTLDEDDEAHARAAFLRDHAAEAQQIHLQEAQRSKRRRAKPLKREQISALPVKKAGGMAG